jgi:hypothetical protein
MLEHIVDVIKSWKSDAREMAPGVYQITVVTDEATGRKQQVYLHPVEYFGSPMLRVMSPFVRVGSHTLDEISAIVREHSPIPVQQQGNTYNLTTVLPGNGLTLEQLVEVSMILMYHADKFEFDLTGEDNW